MFQFLLCTIHYIISNHNIIYNKIGIFFLYISYQNFWNVFFFLLDVIRKPLTYRIETFHGPVGSCRFKHFFFFSDCISSFTWKYIRLGMKSEERQIDRDIIRHIKLQMEITHYSGQTACIDWQSAMWSAETCIPSVCDPSSSHLHLRHQLALKLFQGLWMPSWLWVVQLCPVLRLQRFRWAEFSQYTRSNTEKYYSYWLLMLFGYIRLWRCDIDGCCCEHLKCFFTISVFFIQLPKTADRLKLMTWFSNKQKYI